MSTNPYLKVFLVILLNIINENNAILISQKLINNFSKKEVLINEETKQSLMKTICSGISIYPDNATTIDVTFSYTLRLVRT